MPFNTGWYLASIGYKASPLARHLVQILGNRGPIHSWSLKKAVVVCGGFIKEPGSPLYNKGTLRYLLPSQGNNGISTQLHFVWRNCWKQSQLTFLLAFKSSTFINCVPDKSANYGSVLTSPPSQHLSEWQCSLYYRRVMNILHCPGGGMPDSRRAKM